MRGGSKGFACFALAVVLAGCGGGSGLAGRELRDVEETRLAPDSGAYTARVALPFEFSAEDGADRIDIALGEETVAMSCYVYAEEADLGATSLRLVQGGRAYFDKEHGEFALKQLSGIRVGQVEGSPYHALEWTYSDPEKGSAQIKAATANKQGHGIACLDLNLGFRETFTRVFEGLVASFAAATPPRRPYFEEITVSTIGGLEVGVTWLRLTLDEDGDTRGEGVTSLLIPTGADDMLVSYKTRVEWARPDGSLINASVSDVDLEAESTRLDLRQEDGIWQVRGHFKGKELNTPLKGGPWIDTLLTEYRRVRRELIPHGDQRVVRLAQWVPSADPTGVLQATFEVTPDEPLRYTMTAGPIVSTGNRSAEGFVDSSVVDLGANPLHTKVLYRSGDL